MKLIILWMALMLSVSCAGAELGDQAVFDEANTLFIQANEKSLVSPDQAQDLYQKSILKYQFLVDQRGVRSAELHTNLGNAWFLTGDNGRAVLSYQRALHADPLHEDVLHNLRYVRSLTIDELPMTRRQMLLKALSFWHRWPFVVRALCFGFAHAAFWVILARMFYHRNRLLDSSVALAAVMSLLFGVSLLASHLRWDNPVDGVVLAKEIIARQGDGVIYDNAFTASLHAGTEFTLIGRRGEWYHVRLLNGDTCWLSAQDVELVSAE